MKSYIGLILLWISIRNIPIAICKSRESLTEDIFVGYSKSVRPVSRFNESVRVMYKLYLNQLLDVNEVSQKIDTQVWLSHTWIDPRLTWNPDDYEGAEYTHIETERIWLPDFMLYNNADGDFAVTKFTKAKLHYSGKIEWKPPAIFSSFCEIQVTNFPFDTQNCTMKIGPWTEGQDMLDMVNSNGLVENHVCEEPDISGYTGNGEWDILTTGCYKHYIKYSCCLGPYVDMTYHFVLQRRPLYLVVNILIPTLLFSLLTSAVFYLPSDAGEKMTLSVSLLLSLVVFLLVIVEAVPSTANGIPLLGQYLIFTMILVTLSIILTVGILNIHYRNPSTHSMPDWVKRVFILWIPKFFISSTMKQMNPFSNEDDKRDFFKDISDISGRDVGPEKPTLLSLDAQEAIDGVRLLAEHYKEAKDDTNEAMMWKYVAMVIDHCLLYIFMVVCVVGTLAIFAKRLIELQDEAERYKNNNGECLLNCYLK